jgi:PadR family transcriptional regulator, regulatory protein AphA
VAETPALNATSYALLGQLALRPWSVYDMTKNVGRTLHWFWPRAESVIYAEMKRLAQLGLARGREQPGRRGRPQTTYAITAKGRRELRAWLATDPGGFSLHFEALLRVHLAPYGATDDLTRALASARDAAEGLLRQAVVIGTEFAEERHQFQDQVHIRAILFDFLWRFGLAMHVWADHWIGRVATWPGIEITDAARAEALALIKGHLADAPDAIGPSVEPLG